MKLIYRGTTYDYNPSQSVARRPFQSVRRSQTAYDLIYRGATYHVDPNVKPTEVSQPSKTYQLTYRGTTYWVNRNEQGEVTAAIQPTNTRSYNHSNFQPDF